MSLGVLNNIAAIYAQNNLNNTQASLQTTLQQLSSGSRINSGADDAAGLSVSDGLNANIAALSQSSQNATDGIGLLQTADGALSQVTSLLDRATTLATEAANGTLNGSQVSSANQEYQNILSEIGNIGSTTNFNGNSVFSNQATTVFVSDGTSNGSAVFSEVTGTLSASNVGETEPTGAVGPALATTAVAPTGTVAGTLTFAAPANSTDTLSGSFSISMGGGTAVSLTVKAGSTMTDAVSQLNTQLGAAGSTLTAAVTGGKVVISTAATAPTTDTLAITSGALHDTPSTAPTLMAAPTIVAPTATVGGTATFAALPAGGTISGTLAVQVAGGSSIISTITTGTSLSDAVSQLNAQYSQDGSGLTASQGTGANAGQLVITGAAGVANVLTTTGTSLVSTPGSATTPGAGVDFTAAGVSTLTADTAQNVLTSVTNAIAGVAYQRGVIGADINELTAASNVASAESTNLTSAQSAIDSTDYGQATSNLAKYQVLSQTGISALAQANTVQQEVLKLLQ
ncbi:hypothetical protein FTO74_12225 [Granulicella sp. WH15]|uniref:flagellin N-terminal helical domain-containing protein n=1 Tax=Granulicella sp. WH15 TaxID=2602070 RepID=UPI001366D68C|nr:flagellin [Granulicella sp. WH15]QHN04053.1 hypothetical protein FTO74_12225 [Granulicella sp. WH15]